MATATYITRTEAAELSGVRQTTINKAIEQGVVPTRKLKAGRLLDALEVGPLVLFQTLAEFRLPIKEKKRLRSWLREPKANPEISLSPVLVVRRTAEIDKAMKRAARYAELKDRYLEVNPRVQGGTPVIRGTRMPIRSLAKQIEAGDGPKVLKQDYPLIPEEAYEFAVFWARANPQRGRPVRPWSHDKPGREPEGRAVRVQERRERERQRAEAVAGS